MMLQRARLTLSEQMHITDADIQSRLELAFITPAQLSTLVSIRTLVEDKVDELVEEFYTIQLSIDDIAILIGDSDTLLRLKQAQRQYILDLFSGKCDSTYVNNRLRIGLVHKRIGVEPKLYLSAVSTLKSILFELVDKSIEEHQRVESIKNALDRLFYFDTTLVFDTYIASMISEIDVAKKKTEKYANSLEQKVAERTAQLEALAKQDPLTGLYNQRVMHELASQMLSSVKRRNSVISVIYCDIDAFKLINDKHGHIKGDEVLKALGNILQANIREVDIPCRYGGDEYCVVMPDSDVIAARVVGERIIGAFSNAYPDFSISMGIAQTGPDNFVTETELVELADTKMYEAKSHSGSYIQV